jgi:SPP1 family predicted phage head-tail adaptor
VADCVAKVRKSKTVCIGSLNKRIIVQTRSIVPPINGSVDYTLNFTDPKTVWAMIETRQGSTTFDETNTEKVWTHDFYIRYIAGITFEKWVTYDGKYYDIISVENLNMDDRFLRLRCNIRGTTAFPVNEA